MRRQCLVHYQCHGSTGAQLFLERGELMRKLVHGFLLPDYALVERLQGRFLMGQAYLQIDNT